MFRATAICALCLGVTITAVLLHHEVSRHDSPVQSLPAPPLLHQPGPSVRIPDTKPSKPRSVSRGHQTGAKAQVALPSVGPSQSVGQDSKPATVSPQTPVSKPGAGRTKPPTVRPTPRKPKTPPKASPGPPTSTSPPPATTTTVTSPGPTASPDPTREPAGSSPPPTTTPTPPPTTPPPVDSRPGHGYGDDNHDHTGPPGQSKDGGGHGDSNGNGNHGNSNKHGGGSGDDGSD
jgi:hypothetical protein